MRWKLLAAALVSTYFQFSTPSFGQAKLPNFLDKPHTAYADSVLATLTLREQIAQLLMPPIYAHATRENWDEMERWIETHQLGGVIAMQGAPAPYAERLSRLQARARIPLLGIVFFGLTYSFIFCSGKILKPLAPWESCIIFPLSPTSMAPLRVNFSPGLNSSGI